MPPSGPCVSTQSPGQRGSRKNHRVPCLDALSRSKLAPETEVNRQILRHGGSAAKLFCKLYTCTNCARDARIPRLNTVASAGTLTLTSARSLGTRMVRMGEGTRPPCEMLRVVSCHTCLVKLRRDGARQACQATFFPPLEVAGGDDCAGTFIWHHPSARTCHPICWVLLGNRQPLHLSTCMRFLCQNDVPLGDGELSSHALSVGCAEETVSQLPPLSGLGKSGFAKQKARPGEKLTGHLVRLPHRIGWLVCRHQGDRQCRGRTGRGIKAPPPTLR